jgi:hypothetical protein
MKVDSYPAIVKHEWRLSAALFENILQFFSIFVEDFFSGRFRRRGVARLGPSDRSASIGALFASTGEIVPVKPNQKSDQPSNQRHAGIDQKNLEPAPLAAVSAGRALPLG